MARFREFVMSQPEKPADVASAIGALTANKGGKPAALPIMNVQSGEIDARISAIGFDRAYNNMCRACDQILSDEAALVQTVADDAQKYGEDVVPGERPEGGSKSKLMPWGKLFFMSTSNRPERGYIEIEYRPQATKGMIGDLGFTAGWLAEKPMTRPFRWAAEKMGWAENPEKFYLAQFLKELRRLANQQVLLGLDEWTTDTSYLGRNIIIKPK